MSERAGGVGGVSARWPGCKGDGDECELGVEWAGRRGGEAAQGRRAAGGGQESAVRVSEWMGRAALPCPASQPAHLPPALRAAPP